METLSYLKCKSMVTVMRAGLKYPGGSPAAYPDEVLQIPSRDSDRTIKAHVYRSKADVKPSPVLLNYHGSGFVFPMHGSDNEFCRYISQETDYTVVDIQYRLSPENPFPAALHDTEDTVKWALDSAQGFDTSHISMSGFSAGANLSLVASSCSFPKGTIHSLIAFYPPTDLSRDPAIKIAPDPAGKPIPAFMMNLFNECYIPSGADPKDPQISPLFAAPESFPDRILFISCARDSLAPEAEELAEKIGKVPGVHCVTRRMEGCDHAWNLSVKEGTPQEKSKDEAYAMAVELLRL